MSIPGFQEILLPLLNVVSDRKEWHIKNTREIICNHFNLTEEERLKKLPSAYETVIYNRIHWARLYLVKAGLLNATRRGYIQLSEAGQKLLDEKPVSLDVSFLRQHYPALNEYLDTSNGKKESSSGTPVVAASPDHNVLNETPEEILQQSHITLEKQLTSELLEQIKEMSPHFFERLVVDLLKKMGYGGPVEDSSIVTPRSNDGGIDGIIKEDRLGLETIYIQAKRYKDTAVGRPEIQAFVGAIHGQRSRKGVFITTSTFAKNATAYAKTIETKIILIDGRRLAEYMVEYNLGVTTTQVYEIKRIDSDYFTDD